MRNEPKLTRDAPAQRRGGALLYALIAAVLMAGMCTALLAVTMGTQRSREQGRTLQRSFYAAEAGLSEACMSLTEGTLVVPAGTVASLGTPADPRWLGTTSYFVEVEAAGSRSFVLTSTGADGLDQQRLAMVLSKEPTGFFQFAAFGADGVVLDSNSFIDSYDSALGSYASQVKGGNDFARENGDIGSNGDILLKSNTEVHGDVRPGPEHVVNDAAPNIYVSGSMEPLEEEIELPPIDIPVVPSSGNLVGNGVVVMGPGQVHYDSVLMQGGSTLVIRGPATIVADDFVMKSNTKLVFDPSKGEIELYSKGDFVLESNSDVKTLSDSALDVTLMLDGNNLKGKGGDKIQLGANADFIGAIYAPNAEFKLASNFDIFGSIMCRRLDLSSFGTIHFDEALLYDGHGASGELETILWQRMPLQ